MEQNNENGAGANSFQNYPAQYGFHQGFAPHPMYGNMPYAPGHNHGQQYNLAPGHMMQPQMRPAMHPQGAAPPQALPSPGMQSVAQAGAPRQGLKQDPPPGGNGANPMGGIGGMAGTSGQGSTRPAPQGHPGRKTALPMKESDLAKVVLHNYAQSPEDKRRLSEVLQSYLKSNSRDKIKELFQQLIPLMGEKRAKDVAMHFNQNLRKLKEAMLRQHQQQLQQVQGVRPAGVRPPGQHALPYHHHHHHANPGYDEGQPAQNAMREEAGGNMMPNLPHNSMDPAVGSQFLPPQHTSVPLTHPALPPASHPYQQVNQDRQQHVTATLPQADIQQQPALGAPASYMAALSGNGREDGIETAAAGGIGGVTAGGGVVPEGSLAPDGEKPAGEDTPKAKVPRGRGGRAGAAGAKAPRSRSKKVKVQADGDQPGGASQVAVGEVSPTVNGLVPVDSQDVGDGLLSQEQGTQPNPSAGDGKKPVKRRRKEDDPNAPQKAKRPRKKKVEALGDEGPLSPAVLSQPVDAAAPGKQVDPSGSQPQPMGVTPGGPPEDGGVHLDPMQQGAAPSSAPAAPATGKSVHFATPQPAPPSATKRGRGRADNKRLEDVSKPDEVTDILTDVGIRLEEEADALLDSLNVGKQTGAQVAEDPPVLNEAPTMKLVATIAKRNALKSVGQEVFKLLSVAVDVHVSHLLRQMARMRTQRADPVRHLEEFERSCDDVRMGVYRIAREEREAAERRKIEERDALVSRDEKRKRGPMEEHVKKAKAQADHQNAMKNLSMTLGGIFGRRKHGRPSALGKPSKPSIPGAVSGTKGDNKKEKSAHGKRTGGGVADAPSLQDMAVEDVNGEDKTMEENEEGMEVDEPLQAAPGETQMQGEAEEADQGGAEGEDAQEIGGGNGLGDNMKGEDVEGGEVEGELAPGVKAAGGAMEAPVPPVAALFGQGLMMAVRQNPKLYPNGANDLQKVVITERDLIATLERDVLYNKSMYLYDLYGSWMAGPPAKKGYR